MKKFNLGFFILAVFLLWTLIQSLVSLYPTYLWFGNLGFTQVFWVNIWAKFLTGIVFGAVCLLIISINILIAQKLTKNIKTAERKGPEFNFNNILKDLFGEGVTGHKDEEGFINVTPQQKEIGKKLSSLWWVGVIVLSFFMGFTAVTQWQVFLKFLNASAFGITDPIFNLDIGFYIFSLPLQKFAQGFIFSCLLISLIVSLVIYVTKQAITLNGVKLAFSKGVKAHLAFILAIFTLLLAWGLWLGELEILYSARGVVYGAGYTDVKAQLLGYNTQIVVLLVLAVLFLVNIFQSGYSLPLIGIVGYLVVAIVMGGIYPAIVQNFQVKPNEISLEAPYIANAIKYTRLAYGLDQVEEKEFPAKDNLTIRDLNRNSRTVNNIRLWDPRPLIKTYRQLQGIRLYYDFSDVDVDRYTINGRYQQVMLSPRELYVNKLPEQAQTWVNQHLIFTHGYGFCLSPVSKQTQEGMPDLLVKDIPPVTKTNLKIERPEIYYGENTDNYVIVNTKEQEFDYPKGDKNVYASYQGRGGVQINSFFKKLAFAIKFSDMRILLTGYITSDSRLMFDRSIKKRVKNIAPFLAYDRDPYIVNGEDGKLYWIQDAYTVSDLYPYSDPTGSGYNKFNYIRNSVKIVMDAYNGELTFYIVDDKDPIVKTYQKIYPKLFKSFAKMPEDLKKHMRYPYDLYMIQAQKYATFHMDNPQVFYNREDLWNIPNENYSGNEQLMEAYYTIMKIPGERKEEFLLMLPFTPNNKDNMIAWMAGRCDMPNYGKLVVYKFPKDKLIYGPMQIEARIDQQTEISQQFTLWGQGGSRIIRGNLLAIPIEDSIVYVEPIYLEASSGELPELKRVIVSYGKNVAMAENLNAALSAVFSRKVSMPDFKVEGPKQLTERDIAREAIQKIDELKKLLQKLVR